MLRPRLTDGGVHSDAWGWYHRFVVTVITRYVTGCGCMVRRDKYR